MNVIAAALLALSLSSRAAETPTGLRVVSVELGVLTYQGEPVPPGTYLPAGGEFQLSDGNAVISVGKAGKIMLKGPSSFKPLPGKQAGLSLAYGSLLAALPGLRGRFRVVTPSVAAAVRGTDFYIKDDGDGSAYVCVCDGKVSVSSSRNQTPDSLLVRTKKKHKASVFRPSRQGLGRKDAFMEGHTDEERQRLASEP